MSIQVLVAKTNAVDFEKKEFERHQILLGFDNSAFLTCQASKNALSLYVKTCSKMTGIDSSCDGRFLLKVIDKF